MRDLGMETARVEHDAENAAASALYRGLGFIKKYETLGYRRQ
jgi:mycothiol synthase